MLQFEFSRQKYLEILYSIWLEIAWLDYGCFGLLIWKCGFLATFSILWLFWLLFEILATFWNNGYFSDKLRSSIHSHSQEETLKKSNLKIRILARKSKVHCYISIFHIIAHWLPFDKSPTSSKCLLLVTLASEGPFSVFLIWWILEREKSIPYTQSKV